MEIAESTRRRNHSNRRKRMRERVTTKSRAHKLEINGPSFRNSSRSLKSNSRSLNGNGLLLKIMNSNGLLLKITNNNGLLKMMSSNGLLL